MAALPANTNTYVPQDTAGWTAQAPGVFTPVSNGSAQDVSTVGVISVIDSVNNVPATAYNWSAQTQVLNDKA